MDAYTIVFKKWVETGINSPGLVLNDLVSMYLTNACITPIVQTTVYI